MVVENVDQMSGTSAPPDASLEVEVNNLLVISNLLTFTKRLAIYKIPSISLTHKESPPQS